MAITFSQEIFEKICSSATHSTAEVYDMIAPHLETRFKASTACCWVTWQTN